MKIVYNVEVSHVNEFVISHKVFYVKNDEGIFERDDERTVESTKKKNSMPKLMSAEEVADYVRDYVGSKKWKIVISSGTINLFKDGTTQKVKEMPDGIIISFKQYKR